MRKYFPAILIAVSAQHSFSQDLRVEIAKCAVIQNEIERLAAFDALAKSLGLSEPAAKSTLGPGKWKVRTSTSPIDDSKSFFLSLDANETIKLRLNSITPTLIVRYSEGELDFFINYEKAFIGSGSTLVTTRIDKSDAATTEWSLSTDHSAVFAPPKVLSALTSGITKTSNTLLVRLTPYGESPITSTFDIAGFREVYRPLVEAMAEDTSKKHKTK